MKILKVFELNQQLTEIYNLTYDDIFRYVLSKCRNIDDVPDIIQNTYMNFYSRLKRGGDIKEPIKYLIQTAKRELYKTYGFWNRANETMPIYSKYDGEDFDNIELEAELDFEIDETNNLLCDEIWKYIKNLDNLTYKIFVLYFQYDDKIKDIAKILKVNESTVKNRLFRTLKQLKEKYNV